MQIVIQEGLGSIIREGKSKFGADINTNFILEVAQSFCTKSY